MTAFKADPQLIKIGEVIGKYGQACRQGIGVKKAHKELEELMKQPEDMKTREKEEGRCRDCNLNFPLSNTEMHDGDGYECPICYQRLQTETGESLSKTNKTKSLVRKSRTTREWEEEFDRRFKSGFDLNPYGELELYVTIKSFIKKVEDTTRTKTLREVEEKTQLKTHEMIGKINEIDGLWFEKIEVASLVGSPLSDAHKHPLQYIAFTNILPGDDDRFQGVGWTPLEALQDLLTTLLNQV